jgi:hypothetical protein
MSFGRDTIYDRADPVKVAEADGTKVEAALDAPGSTAELLGGIRVVLIRSFKLSICRPMKSICMRCSRKKPPASQRKAVSPRP